MPTLIERLPNVDDLAQIIREVDGNHSLGAGLLAEHIVAWLAAQPTPPRVPDGWKEATIAWEICASIHREWAKGKDAFYSTRQSDFVKHAADARKKALKPGDPA